MENNHVLLRSGDETRRFTGNKGWKTLTESKVKAAVLPGRSAVFRESLAFTGQSNKPSKS